MIQGNILYPSDNLTDVFYIRREVFVKEQGIPEEAEFDHADSVSMHAIVYEGLDKGNPVAAGRLLLEGDCARIGRVAVLKEHRGKKYGDFLVRMLIEKALQMGKENIYLHAQIGVVKFYEKIGFQSVGEVFIEDNIPHVKMVYNKDNIRSCCKNK